MEKYFKVWLKGEAYKVSPEVYEKLKQAKNEEEGLEIVKGKKSKK